MHYKYRWIYFLLLITCPVGLACFIDFLPMTRLVASKQHEEKRLLGMLAEQNKIIENALLAKNESNTPNSKDVKQEAVFLLADIAHYVGIDFLRAGFNQAKNWHVEFKGEYRKILQLIVQLSQASFPATICHFNFNDQHILELDFAVLNMPVSRPLEFAPDKIGKKDNLFCHDLNQAPSLALANHRNKYPLGNLRMVGAFHYKNKHLALLALPNGETLAVKELMVVGTEHGVVKTVNARNIVFRLPDGLSYIIKM